MTKYYDEGDKCPNCMGDILVITQCTETGNTSLVCQKCRYDATELEKW